MWLIFNRWDEFEDMNQIFSFVCSFVAGKTKYQSISEWELFSKIVREHFDNAPSEANLWRMLANQMKLANQFFRSALRVFYETDDV